MEPVHAAACMCVRECMNADILIYSRMCNSLRLRLASRFAFMHMTGTDAASCSDT